MTKNRIKLAEKVAKTTEKQLIPNLKKLEEGLGETQLKFVNLTGREGLGGIQLAFREFFMHVWSDATFYLGGTSQTIKTNFSNMKQDFEEFFMALSNIVIFEGKNVRSKFSSLMIALETNVSSSGALIGTAFSKIMTNLEKQIDDLDLEFNTNVAVPPDIFTFIAKSVKVPASTFDTAGVDTAKANLTSLINQINSYSNVEATVSKNAVAVRTSTFSGDWRPAWEEETTDFSDTEKANNVGQVRQLNYAVPSVSGGGSSGSSSTYSPAARNATKGGGGNGVVVNIFDGTGQRISAYDSGIRVEITERASRNGQFAALI